MSAHHLFNDQAKNYAQYRPHYPAELYDHIYSYLGSQGPASLAIDCATGSGQAATALAKKFRQVLAFDVSVNQLSQAAKQPNIEYKQGTAEDIAADDNSADLVAVANALHWFEIDTFVGEAHRVLRPGGVLAIWGNKRPEIKANQKADDLVFELYSGEQYFGPLWDKRVFLSVIEECASVKFDEALFQEVTRLRFPVNTASTVKHFVGYLSTWSAYGPFRRQHPDQEDPLISFKSRLLEALDSKDENASLIVTWPTYLILVRAKS